MLAYRASDDDDAVSISNSGSGGERGASGKGGDSGISSHTSRGEAASDTFALSVVVWHYANRPRPALPPSIASALPPLEKLRAVVFYCVDARADDSATSSRVLSGFKSLAMRAAAQNVFLVPYAAAPSGDVACQLDELAESLGVLADSSGVPSVWSDATRYAPDASLVVCAGALPHTRSAVTVLLSVNGFLSLHDVHVLYGVTPTPAKVFAYVTRFLLAPAMRHAVTPGKGRKANSAFANLFSRAKK